MMTDTADYSESTGSGAIHRDLVNEYKMEMKYEEKMRAMDRQGDAVRNEKNTAEMESLADTERHQMVRIRGTERMRTREMNDDNERKIERELEEDQTKQKEKLRQARADKRLMDMEPEVCESQRALEVQLAERIRSMQMETAQWETSLEMHRQAWPQHMGNTQDKTDREMRPESCASQQWEARLKQLKKRFQDGQQIIKKATKQLQSSAMSIEREMDEEQVSRCVGPPDARPKKADNECERDGEGRWGEFRRHSQREGEEEHEEREELHTEMGNIDAQTWRMRKDSHQTDPEGTPMSSALLVQPTAAGYWTDEADATQTENTKVEREAENPRTDQASRTLEWENTPCTEHISQKCNQSLTRRSNVAEDNMWTDRMEEQKQLESNMDVNCRKESVDEESSQRVQEMPHRDLDTQKEHERLNGLERKSEETVREKEHIKACQESQRQLQEEGEEHRREKRVERESEMKKEPDLWKKNEMEIKEDIERQKKQQRDEQKEKENQLEPALSSLEKLRASRGQYEIGREKQNEMHKRSDMQYLEQPEVAAKARIQKNAKLTEASGWSSVCHRMNEREAIRHFAQRKGPRPLYQPKVQATSIRKPRTRPMRSKSHPEKGADHSSNPERDTLKALSVTEITPCTDCDEPNLTEVLDFKAKENRQENTAEPSRGEWRDEPNMCQFLDMVAHRQSDSEDIMPSEREDKPQVNTEEQVPRGRQSPSQAPDLASHVSGEEEVQEEDAERTSTPTPSADEMAQEEMPGATETADEPSHVVTVGGIARNDKSVRRRIFGWVNEKAKNYYENKIYRTFAREMEEGDQAYQPCKISFFFY